jgi:hypothetical protein
MLRWTTDSARAPICAAEAVRPARPGSGHRVLLALVWPAPAGVHRRRPARRVHLELAFRQLEVADTRVFDRPAAGRAFFEGLIRDHLDVGRPDCVSLTFGRRVTTRTPGAFRTRVVAQGVAPQISCYYRASRIKQYFKAHRALRTETVICDTRTSGSAGASAWRTGMPCGQLASTPTSTYVTLKPQTPSLLPTPSPSPR